MSTALAYRPWIEKHKRPRGFGTWCPMMPDGRAQQLLERAVRHPDPEKESDRLYVVDGRWCFIANPTRIEIGEYHGYPIPGCDMPERILKIFVKNGTIDRATQKFLRSQTALPLEYP